MFLFFSFRSAVGQFGGHVLHLQAVAARTSIIAKIAQKMNAWSKWSACSPNNGKCGAGTQYQIRTVATQPYCSPACPATRQTRSCTHSCCPRDCAVSSWGSWSACSNICGTGTKTRTRRVTAKPYCNGRACPALKDATKCSQYNNRDCAVSSWGSWSTCSNTCGTGTKTRTRRVTAKPYCNGRACPALKDATKCSQYNNRDCVMSSWSSWSICSNGCGSGQSTRTRQIISPAVCLGKACGATTQSRKG
ncbi:unnamed protein product [Porites evermanni]|uniref:Spondin-like TSP1 domain-containing protein n=1 Tax=Porites evermanni TaxID=104178 RepID=A0ABN8SV01_9CNID|nr:unnamed protein product [Porites evermanni]